MGMGPLATPKHPNVSKQPRDGTDDTPVMMPVRRPGVHARSLFAPGVTAVMVVGMGLLWPAVAAGQEADGQASVRFGLWAIPHATRVEPAFAGRTESEVYFSQPMVFAHGRLGWLRATVTINLEGAVLEDGELSPGVSGEGFIDKRHPHTWLHEAMLTAAGRAGALELSASGGRGFVPFGTDDPMVRPFVKYPANHHWSQILERWLLIGAVRYGPVALEAGTFNGDEPMGPGDAGGFDRFGDSWAGRLTLRPWPGVETQASHARVESPENEGGGGLDQRKWSASARLERSIGARSSLYALVEWAETHELAGDRKIFLFTTVLGEAALRTGEWTAALRYERTTRPEEERLLDPFRAVRPHTDDNIVGATRWNTVTAHVGRSFSVRGLGIEPFLELAYSRVAEITTGAFDPVVMFGDDAIRTASVGIRLRAGAGHTRMGRYGAALPAASEHGH